MLRACHVRLLPDGQWITNGWRKNFECHSLKAIAAAAAILLSSENSATAGPPLSTFHCNGACPQGAPNNASIIVREIYTLASDPLTKMSIWVAYRVTPETIGPSQSRAWRPDPWLPPAETLDPKDYEDAPGALGIDRGHQAPLAAFSGTSFWRDTNILSNITPQAAALNQGPWQRLEARETKLANEENIAVYVLTGPLFERMMEPMPKSKRRHRVPSGYWKLVATTDGRVTGFVFDQTTPRDANFCEMRVALDDLELRSRISLYAEEQRPKRSLDEKLGCPER